MPDAAWRHWKPHYRDSRCLTGQIRSERFALPTLQFGLLGFRLSSFIFVSPFLPFLDSPQTLKPKTEGRNHFRFSQFRLFFFLPARRAFRNRTSGNGIVVVVVVGIGRVVMQRPRCQGRMRLLTAIHSPDAIEKILGCVGLPSRS